MNFDKFFLYLPTVLLIVYIYLTPAILELTPRPGASYKFFGNVNYLLETGKISPNVMWYHTWPGFFLIMVSFLSQLSGINSLMILNLYPLIWNILFLPLFVVFLKEFVNEEKTIVTCCWTFIIFNWVGQDYFSPQSLAFFLCVFILLLMTKILKSRIKNQYSLLIILVLTAIILPFTHITTTIFVLFLFVFFGIFFSVKFKNKYNLLLLALFSTILLMITYIVAYRWLSHNIEYFLTTLFNLKFVGITSTLNIMFKGSQTHTFVIISRILITLIILLFTMFSFISLVITKETRLTLKDMAILLYFLGYSSFSLFLVIVYSDETFQRLLLFGLPLFIIIISKNLEMNFNKSPFILIGLLLFSFPLSIISRYGNEAIDYSSLNSLEAGLYVKDLNINFDETIIIGDISMLQLEYPARFIYVQIGELGGEWNSSHFVPKEKIYTSFSQLIIITSRLKWYYNVLENDNFIQRIEVELESSIYYVKIFSSPDASIFISTF